MESGTKTALKTEGVMLFVILGAILGWHAVSLTGDQGLQVFAALFGACIGLAAAFGFGERSKITEEITTKPLASLKMIGPMEGSFFLGCGTIGTNLYYIYYERAEDGSFQLRRKRADVGDTFVREEERKDGTLGTFRRIPPAWTRAWMTFWEEDYLYKFRIPSNSIKKEFTL